MLCVALSACSSSPSEGDLKAALAHKMKADYEALARSTGKQALPPRPELMAVHKFACKPEAKQAYRCDIEIEVNHGGTLAKGTAAMRFHKSDAGWVAGN